MAGYATIKNLFEAKSNWKQELTREQFSPQVWRWFSAWRQKNNNMVLQNRKLDKALTGESMHVSFEQFHKFPVGDYQSLGQRDRSSPHTQKHHLSNKFRLNCGYGRALDPDRSIVLLGVITLPTILRCSPMPWKIGVCLHVYWSLTTCKHAFKQRIKSKKGRMNMIATQEYFILFHHIF